MNVRVAIHSRPGSFSERWIEYCVRNGISHALVNGYASDVLGKLASADAFLWEINNSIPEDSLAPVRVFRAAELMGVKVFPSTATCWHYDDKVAQKYLLEAVGAPLAPIHVFYAPQDALEWIDRTTFPKVFKLRRGAGSQNVRLVHNADQARRLVRKAFGAGFRPIAGYLSDTATRTWKVRRRGDVWGAIKRLPGRLLAIHRANRLMGREKGYVYFQDFIAGNTFDTRITVIGNRAFAFTRDVRPGDFRASGSGRINYDLDRVDPRCIRIAHDATRKIGAQSLAFDFVRNAAGEPRIVEVSYTYLAKPVYDCAGQWDDQLGWHEGHVWPQDAILEDLLNSLGR